MGNLARKFASSDFIQVLVHPPYLLFSLVVIFSQIAFNMANVVLIFLVYFLTGSNLLVSMILIVSLLPQILLSFFGGIVADLRNKKNILLYGNLLRAAVLLTLLVGYKSLLAIFIAAFISSVVTQFYTPAEAPVIPKLVKPKHLVAANSIFGLTLFGSILMGFVLAGPTVDVLGRSAVFIVVAGFFALAALCTFLIPGNLFSKTSAGHTYTLKTALIKDTFSSYLFESYKLIKTTKDVTAAFLLLIISQVIIFVLAVMVPGYAKTVLMVSAEKVSLALFAPAALGMVITAVVIGSIGARFNREKLMNIGVFFSGIVLVLFPIITVGFIKSIYTFFPGVNILHAVAVLAFFAGVGNALIFIPSQTTIQEKIPEDFRSKVYGLLFALIGAFSIFPIIAAGGLADVIGVGTVLIVVGIAVLLGASLQLFMIISQKKQ